MVGISGIIEKFNPQEDSAKSNSSEIYFDADFSFIEKNESYSLALSQAHPKEKQTLNLALPYFETEDKQYCCGLVGGVYNRKELRDRQISLGYVFKGLQDAELIIYLYKQYGILNLEKLEGSFALFLLDRKANKLILARDTHGSKPLYFSFEDNKFAFSSDVKTLSKLPFVKTKLGVNWEQISNFLRYGDFAFQKEFYVGLEAFPAGNYAIIDLHSQQFYIRNYGQTNPHEISEDTNEEDSLKTQTEILTDGLLKQQVKDIQSGLILDGSASSVCLAAIIQKNSSKKLKTYSIHNKASKYSWANRHVIKKHVEILKTKHNPINIEEIDPIALLNEWFKFYSNPVADLTGIIQLAIAKQINQDISVLWNSFGVEYIYGSSTSQKMMKKLIWLFSRIPKFLLPLAYKWYKLKPELHLENHSDEQESKLFLAINEIFKPNEIQQLFHPSLANGISNLDLNWPSSNYISHLAQGYLPYQQSKIVEPTYLQFGMENRNAFITNKLWYSTLKNTSIFNQKTNASFLDKLVSFSLSERVKFMDYKNFYSGLLIEWMNNQWRSVIDQHLNINKIEQQRFFQPLAIENIKNAFFNKPNYKNAQKLWIILQLQVWFTDFFTSKD